MKRILIVCLLGMGLLLPSTTITAKEFFTKKIVDVTIEDDWLLANSDASTGTITKVEIFQHGPALITQSCSGYECAVDVSSLANGSYSAKVTTTLTTYSEGFYIGG